MLRKASVPFWHSWFGNAGTDAPKSEEATGILVKTNGLWNVAKHTDKLPK